MWLSNSIRQKINKLKSKTKLVNEILSWVKWAVDNIWENFYNNASQVLWKWYKKKIRQSSWSVRW